MHAASLESWVEVLITAFIMQVKKEVLDGFGIISSPGMYSFMSSTS